MKIDMKGLTRLLNEYNALTEKRKLDPQDKARISYLQAAIACLRSGATMEEVEQDRVNAVAAEAGLPHTSFGGPTREQRALVYALNAMARGVELRDSVEGVPLTSQLGTYTGLGFFVPTGFMDRIFSTIRAADPLLSDEDVTCINSDNGRPLAIPTIGDIEQVATTVGEGNDEGESDITSTGHVVLDAWKYKSPRFVVSNEAFQDLDTGVTTLSLFERFASQRLQRGIGQDLLQGNGSSRPLGLVPALAASGRPPVTAAGSAVNTGNNAQTGSNSIGTPDLASLFLSVNSAYRSSDKCAWLMADSTLSYIEQLTDKMGRNLEIVKYPDGDPVIYGKPVKISPSMEPIGAGNTPVLFGDMSYFVTRIVTSGEGIGIKVFTEAPGLVESGKVALRCFVRASGVYAYTDSASDAPIAYLNNHS